MSGAARPSNVRDLGQDRPAPHDADDHVGHEHERAQAEDDRADGVALPPVPEKGHLGLVAELLAQRPEPRADEKNRQRNDQPRGRGHQTVDADALAIGLAGAAKDGKRRHVRRENRKKKHHPPYRAVGQEKVLGVGLAAPEGDAAHECDEGQVKQDDENGCHILPASSRCLGQANLTSTAMVRAARTE